jgi:hypothetical protein
MRPNVMAVVLLVAMTWTGVSRAQLCGRDSDCAGDLVCTEGRCLEEGQRPPRATLPALQPMPDRPRGWATAGGVTGLVLSSVVLGLGMASEATRAKNVPAIPLGATATVIFTATVPIAAAGGASTRRLMGVEGSRGLRIAGWVLYAASVALAMVPLGYGVAQKTPPAGMIASITGTAFLSGTFMSIDDFITSRQAEHAQPRAVTLSYTTSF